ncbi:MAG: DUF2461 domain-containing protein [Nitrospirae bacterium]|nr:DUF2461 domain-containing protein [Nitrospirota bacterium]
MKVTLTHRIYFNADFFKFLTELKMNNNREWFTANKARYIAEVRNPSLDFIRDFAPHLQKISRHYVADSRPVGGSLFRIYRDARFSKDKSPYKTMAGIHFRHEMAKDAHAPGFYLHLEPGNSFAGAGIWHPERDTLQKIREAIANRPKQWKALLSDKRFKKTHKLDGESLVRPPAGFDADHPLIEDLKRKDFVSISELSEKDAGSPDFIDRFARLCQTSAPLTKFLTVSLDLRW